MENQKCPGCSAPMQLINNPDGTTSFICQYCGTKINNQPKTAVDKIFTFANRIANAFKEEPVDVEKLSPDQKAAYDAIMERNELRRKEFEEKRKRQAEKLLEKQKRRMGIK